MTSGPDSSMSQTRAICRFRDLRTRSSAARVRTESPHAQGGPVPTTITWTDGEPSEVADDRSSIAAAVSESQTRGALPTGLSSDSLSALELAAGVELAERVVDELGELDLNDERWAPALGVDGIEELPRVPALFPVVGWGEMERYVEVGGATSGPELATFWLYLVGDRLGLVASLDGAEVAQVLGTSGVEPELVARAATAVDGVLVDCGSVGVIEGWGAFDDVSLIVCDVFDDTAYRYLLYERGVDQEELDQLFRERGVDPSDFG